MAKLSQHALGAVFGALRRGYEGGRVPQASTSAAPEPASAPVNGAHGPTAVRTPEPQPLSADGIRLDAQRQRYAMADQTGTEAALLRTEQHGQLVVRCPRHANRNPRRHVHVFGIFAALNPNRVLPLPSHPVDFADFLKRSVLPDLGQIDPKIVS
jgi:hypothetical protein